MKFKLVLVLALVFFCSFAGFSQTTDHEAAEAPLSLFMSRLQRWGDSLKVDLSFQRKVGNLTKDSLSNGDSSSTSILDTPLPNFHLRDLNGKVVDNQQLQGQVVFLHIWYPDYFESPYKTAQLNECKNKYQDRGVIFLSLTWADADYLRDFLQSHPLDFRHLPGASDLISQITLIPQNILVDQHGIIRYTTTDPFKTMFQPKATNWAALHTKIDSLLTK